MAFKDDVRLDITELDKAALNQPSLYAENGELWAEAVLERDRIKERLSAKRTEVDESVRNDPEKYGLVPQSKPTETWISNKIAQHEEVIGLSEQLNEAQYLVNMMVVAKEALDHRLKALSILAELYKGNYFAASAQSKEYLTKAVDDSMERQRRSLENNPKMLARLKKHD
jgi:hypothetical protein